MKKYIFILFVIYSYSSFAYIENVTKGYPTCISCHYSPSGGDLLTDYGRSLSGEMMSTFNNEKFSKALFGQVKESKWVKYGGDLRTIQTYVNSPFVEQGRLFVMQANAELGLKYNEKAMFVGTVGVQGGPSESPDRGDFISERHYFLFNTTESSRLRVGKFRANFGINDPNHTRPIKELIHFGALSETYNIEFTKFTENWELSLTTSFKALNSDDTNSNDEDALMAKFTHFLGGKSRVGASALYGTKDGEDRFVFAGHGIFPIANKFYGIVEVDYETTDRDAVPENELIAAHSRFGYRIKKGLLGYVIFDYAQTNLDDSNSRIVGPGIGLQWFPYPHFELSFEYLRQRVSSFDDDVDGAFFLTHVYF